MPSKINSTYEMESPTVKASCNGKASKTKTKRDENFKYGNYRNYYFKRLGGEKERTDIRLQLMEQHPDYFCGKRMLDIGCNCGLITISVAQKFKPKSIIGVDIDSELINMARRHLEKQKIKENLSSEDLAIKNVIFRTANYILNDRSLIELEKPNYDTILCLSVTKWIHLNFGDDGIKFMFKRIFKQLHPNGILILEAQPFSNYKKRSKLTADILKNYKSIELKPEQFEAYLLSDEIGFSESWCISDNEILKQSNLPKGFHRMLQVFVKRGDDNNKM